MEMTNHAEQPRRRPVVRRAAIALAWFLAAMLALTYLSRALSERLKAQVETGFISASALDESVEGTGEWQLGETQLYTTYYTRRITKLYVKPGEDVVKGEPLFAYDVSTVSGEQEVSDRKLRAAERAVAKAEEALEKEPDSAYTASVLDSARQALLYAEFTYAQTYALRNGGVVCASFSGTLVTCDLSVGKASEAGVTGFTVAPFGTAFTMRVSAKEAERLALGDTVVLQKDGKEEKETLRIAAIGLPDAEERVTIRCEGGGETGRRAGLQQEWRVKKQSARYNTCVPVSALRQNGPDAYYVLVLTEKETILGTQLAVEARQVTLLAHDSRYAAVDGNLSEQDRLVTSSSKELRDGDAVVLKHA